MYGRRNPGDDADCPPDLRGQALREAYTEDEMLDERGYVRAFEAFAEEEKSIFERANNRGEPYHAAKRTVAREPTPKSPYDLAAFVVKHHGGLDDEDTYFLASMKERFYWGSPSCVSDLHQLTILYHEAVGWQQATQSRANRP